MYVYTDLLLCSGMYFQNLQHRESMSEYLEAMIDSTEKGLTLLHYIHPGFSLEYVCSLTDAAQLSIELETFVKKKV